MLRVLRGLVVILSACGLSIGAAASDFDKGVSLYQGILIGIRNAEALESAGKSAEALRAYEDAGMKLLELKKGNASWDNPVTEQKLALCRRAVVRLGGKRGGGEAAGPAPPAPARDSSRGVPREGGRNAVREEGGAAGGGGWLSRIPLISYFSPEEKAIREARAIEAKEAAEREEERTRAENIFARTPEPPAPSPGEPEAEAQSGGDDAEDALRDAGDIWALGDQAAALHLLDALVGSRPDFTGAYRERARIALQAGMYERATEDYRKVISLGGADMDIYYGLGTACEKQAEKFAADKKPSDAAEKYRDAVAAYKNALWHDQRYSPALYSLGCVYARLGRREDALLYFKKAIETAGSDSELGRRAAYNIKLLGG